MAAGEEAAGFTLKELEVLQGNLAIYHRIDFPN